jgi:hypothetical protein
MRRSATTLRLLALLWLGLGAAGCKQSDTVLLVTVYGPSSLKATQLSVTVTAGIDARNILVPATPGDVIPLPASFTISLDRSHMGPITISIDALDSSGTIGFGTTMMQHIQIGGQTDIAVMLMEGLPPDQLPDAGVDGPGAGGTAGSGGAGAGGVEDGGAGRDGASGADGAAGSGADAMGLDGATG